MATPTVKSYDPEIHAAFLEWRDESGLTNRQIARLLSVDDSAITRYAKGEPTGNVEQLEASIADTIANSNQAAPVQYFETAITRQIHNIIAKTRQVNGIALINAEAGLGKTTALELYKQKRPDTLLITGDCMRRNHLGVLRLAWNQIDHSGWKRECPMFEYFFARFEGSNRLLIIDEAQLLSASGLQFGFDFHRITGCPVVFAGNPEVLRDIARGRSAPQKLRRIIHCMECKWNSNAQIWDAVDKTLDIRVPKKWHSETLRQQAFNTAKGTGYLGALDTRLSVAGQYMKTGQFHRFSDAFSAAHAHMALPKNLL